MNIQIGTKNIGYSSPCYIIAEGCDNHLGNLDVAREMILQAKLAGADAIKFQHHLPDEEMLPDSPTSANFQEPLYDFLQKYALKIGGHRELMAYARSVGIHYMCTPFSYKAAEEMVAIGLDAIKIGSGEMTDIPSLKKMATFLGKPMIVSTGMATYDEIDRTYNVINEIGVPLALMYCVSEYPPVYEDMNILSIATMIKRYPCALIGHSDHTPDLFTCFAAVTLGAKIIEKHVILDKRQSGPDQSVSIDFQDLKTLVDGIRKIEASLGNQKIVHNREKDIRKWAFRSIVTTCDIRAGEQITEDKIWSKRPGTGIPSHLRDNIIGRNILKNVAANTLLKWEDIDGDKIE